MPTDDATPTPAAGTLDRLAATLDAAGVTLEVLARDFANWHVWHSEVSGAYHARRRENRFQEHPSDGRRFAVAAATVPRLAVLLLAQAAADAEVENGASGA